MAFRNDNGEYFEWEIINQPLGDEKYRLNIDLDIDIALCFKLENGKGILLSYDFDNEIYLVNSDIKKNF